MKSKQTKESTNLLRSCLPADKRNLTELHVHLGGSVPIYRLWEMGIARGIRGVANSYEDFINLLHRSKENTGDLDQYLEVFDTVELIQAGPAAVAESILIALNGAFRTGGMTKLGPGGEGGDPDPVCKIDKLELRFNPMKRTGVIFSRGEPSGLFDVDRIIRAACEAVEESELAYKGAIRSGLIFCFGRDMPWEVNYNLAEKIAHWKKSYPKIIGIDLAGPESSMNLEQEDDLRRMGEIYDIAAGDDLGRTVHVGETEHVSVETFVKTIKALKPHRVAHPVVAIKAYWNDKDASGLEALAERDICCELCVKSNILTGAVEDAAEYGRLLKTFDEFKIPYTFSTDSPALQMTTLANELEFLLANKAITAEQILNSIENANRFSFIDRISNKET
jgi:adenosine deaminase